jgi:uncharacterized SAM-binding protein YcdF (DUF218 family)
MLPAGRFERLLFDQFPGIVNDLSPVSHAISIHDLRGIFSVYLDQRVKVGWIRLFGVRFSRLLMVAAVGALTALLVGGYVGVRVYTDAIVDPLAPADAIIVLGGEHDGREDYGFELARQGVARNVVLSDPYGPNDRTMARYCETEDARFDVICVPPTPANTRGEAMITRSLAVQHGWNKILVISWRYHLPRARYIFSNCFGGEIAMRPVPREYDYGPAYWGYVYLYQSAGFVKAFIQRGC